MELNYDKKRMKSPIVSSYQSFFNSDEQDIYNNVYIFIIQVIFVTFIYVIFTVSMFAMHSNVLNNKSSEFLMNVSLQDANQLQVQANFNVLAGIFLIFLYLFYRKKELFNFKAPLKSNKKQLFISNLPLNIGNSEEGDKHLQDIIYEKGFLIKNVALFYENSKKLFEKTNEVGRLNKNEFVGRALLTFVNMHGFYFFLNI